MRRFYLWMKKLSSEDIIRLIGAFYASDAIVCLYLFGYNRFGAHLGLEIVHSEATANAVEYSESDHWSDWHCSECNCFDYQVTTQTPRHEG